jgi:hypothetical protein
MTFDPPAMAGPKPSAVATVHMLQLPSGSLWSGHALI